MAFVLNGKEVDVWVIDSQQWPRAYLRAELIERGYETIGFMDVGDALWALRHPENARPRVIVLELCELRHERTDLLSLVDAGIKTVVLGGAVELAEEWVKAIPWEAVIQRPVTIGEIADLVGERLRAMAPST